MVAIYKSPGVHVEERSTFPPSIAGVATSVPAFIGYTTKTDRTLQPTRIESLVEYEQFFGNAPAEATISIDIAEQATGEPLVTAQLDETKRNKKILPYAMQLFFANGGGPAYVISVGGAQGDPSQDELASGLGVLELIDEPTMILFPDASNLSVGDYKSLADAALAQCAARKDRFTILDVVGEKGGLSLKDAQADLKSIIDTFRNGGVGTNNLAFGAAYAPYLETDLDYPFEDKDVVVTHKKKTGNPGDFDTKTLSALSQTGGNLALYERAVGALRAKTMILPPSPAMAGVYTQVDSRGVWQAPANVSLNRVIAPTVPISSSRQDDMNVDATAGKSVNAIRSFTGKGTLVWGARTLAGNSLEWRYIGVRRFFNFVEESVSKATEQFVFSPNDANTWIKVQAMIENFLTSQWRAGALQGIKPEHAFFVSVGLGRTMTAVDILEGRMTIRIGMAVVRPAEFIVLEFTHKMAES